MLMSASRNQSGPILRTVVIHEEASAPGFEIELIKVVDSSHHQGALGYGAADADAAQIAGIKLAIRSTVSGVKFLAEPFCGCYMRCPCL